MAPRTKAPARNTSPAKKLPQKAAAKAKPKATASAKPEATASAKPKATASAKPKAKLAAKATPPAKAKPASAKAKPPANAKPIAAKAKPPAKAKPASAKAKSSVVKKTATPKASPAREALKAAAMKKAIEQVIAPVENDTAVVEAYMRDLDHPFKAELEAIRAVILGASDKISERIKWNAPNFYYGADDLAAFNPSASEYAHLILLFPSGLGLPAKSSLLEGKAKDRREAKFSSMEDVQSKKPALQKLIKAWLKLRA